MFNLNMLYVVLSQCGFSFFRTLNVRYTAADMVWHSVITSTIVKVFWLTSTFLGIVAMNNSDFLTLSMYVVSGVLGDYFSFKIKFK